MYKVGTREKNKRYLYKDYYIIMEDTATYGEGIWWISQKGQCIWRNFFTIAISDQWILLSFIASITII